MAGIHERLQTDLRKANCEHTLILALIDAPGSNVTPARLIAKWSLDTEAQADLTAIKAVYDGLSAVNQAKYLHVVRSVFGSIRNDMNQELTYSQARTELGI